MELLSKSCISSRHAANDLGITRHMVLIDKDVTKDRASLRCRTWDAYRWANWFSDVVDSLKHLCSRCAAGWSQACRYLDSRLSIASISHQLLSVYMQRTTASAEQAYSESPGAHLRSVMEVNQCLLLLTPRVVYESLTSFRSI